MRRIFFWLLVTILFLTLQRIFADYFSISRATPDLILIATVYFALSYGPGWGQSLGFISGILQDAFSVYLFGANALIKAIVGFTVGRLKKRLDVSNMATQVIVVFCAAILNYVIHYFVKIIFHARPAPFRGLTFLVFILYNSIVAPFLFLFLRKAESIFRKKETQGQNNTYTIS